MSTLSRNPKDAVKKELVFGTPDTYKLTFADGGIGFARIPKDSVEDKVLPQLANEMRENFDSRAAESQEKLLDSRGAGPSEDEILRLKAKSGLMESDDLEAILRAMEDET